MPPTKCAHTNVYPENEGGGLHGTQTPSPCTLRLCTSCGMGVWLPPLRPWSGPGRHSPALNPGLCGQDRTAVLRVTAAGAGGGHGGPPPPALQSREAGCPVPQGLQVYVELALVTDSRP